MVCLRSTLTMASTRQPSTPHQWTPQPGKPGLCPLDAYRARRIPERAGRCKGANALVHRSDAKRTPGIPSRRLGDAQQPQHQNAPPSKETRLHESGSLPDQENCLPLGRPPYVTVEMEDPQCRPCLATRTRSNKRTPSASRPFKCATRGKRH